MVSGITNNASPSNLPVNTSKVDYKMEFLQLLMTQLKHQDPTAPFDSQQMLAQQAQFASLEQMQNLNTNLLTLLAMQNVSQATNLLGRTVSGTGTDGNPVNGTVAGIGFAGGVSTLTVDVGGGITKELTLPNVTSIGL